MKPSVPLLFVVLSTSLFAGEGNELQPLMSVPGAITYQSDFATPGRVDKADWQRKQGTRWTVAKGVLRGQQSPADYQAKKDHHQGLDPRITSLKTPQQFVAKISVRFIDGEETKLIPLIEFGHHNVRLKFSESGVTLLSDHETLQLGSTERVRLESGKWYHLLAERHGDEFVCQFANGPTLYAKHPSVSQPVAGQRDGLSVAGPRRGYVEIDNVTIWSVKQQKNTWPETRSKLPVTSPKVLPKKQKKQK